MTTRVPDLEQLAQGSLCLLEESDADYCSVKIQLYRHGLKLADDRTWRSWRRFRWVELWQAVALQLHLDPDTVSWHTLGARHHARLSISQLYGSLMQAALKHVDHESLPILATAEHPRRVRVAPWEFAAWCDAIGTPCPVEFQREDPSGKAAPAAIGRFKRRSAPPDGYFRQADLIPGMLPFSHSTLWRMVKKGEFPAPSKFSRGVTAWKRQEVLDWIAAHEGGGARRRSRK